MPSKEVHLRKARENKSFYDSCENSEDVKISANHCEWAIIVRFYECLHIVETITATKNIHFPNHEKRNDGLYHWSTLFDKQFADWYNDLYTLSWRARYTEARMTYTDVTDCDEAYTYILNYAATKHGLTI